MLRVSRWAPKLSRAVPRGAARGAPPPDPRRCHSHPYPAVSADDAMRCHVGSAILAIRIDLGAIIHPDDHHRIARCLADAIRDHREIVVQRTD